MKHTCKSCIIHCIDFRFQKLIDKFLQEHNLINDCDRIAIPGSVQNFEIALKYLELSHQLHETKNIYLINHQDCGAYALGNIEKTTELEIHKKDLENIKNQLLQKHPDLRVECYFVTLDNTFIKI